jgi:hypothetical protein
MRIHIQQSITKSKSSNNEEENSCYYPGCKKNANCNCEFCIASINATLDLIPNSTLTKFSSSKPNNLNNNNSLSPISFDSSFLSTPENSFRGITTPPTPIIKSSAKSNQIQRIERKKKEKKRHFYSDVHVLNVMMVLGFLFFADIVLSKVVSVVFQPSLSPDLIKRVGEKCHEVQDLNGKLRFLQKELGNIVHGEVSNCSFTDTSWEINQVKKLRFLVFIEKKKFLDLLERFFGGGKVQFLLIFELPYKNSI